MIDLQFVLLVLAGSLAGLLIGAMPGLSVTMATALLVSVTYTWQLTDAIAAIMGVYVVGVFSGAISAILINIPGAPSSVATTLDGFPMAQKGQARQALFLATIYSFVGTLIGFLALWLTAKPISAIALRFSPFDYFLLALFGLTAAGSITSKSFTKGMLCAALGVLISLVGIDPIVGTPRFAFGVTQLKGGIQLVAALIGLFGFSEILIQVGDKNTSSVTAELDKHKPNLRQTLKHMPLAMTSGIIGTLIGALPGAGGPVASLVSYDVARRRIKNPEVPFGEGAEEGIVASETANNACIGGALIPMLTLAIPGDAVTAVILAVFYVHGIKPGPFMLTENPEIFNTILIGGIIGCFAMLILGLTVAPQLARIVQIPKKLLLPVVAVLCVVGTYAVNTSMFDVYVMIAFGLIGYLMRLRGYPTAPMVLGMVLGQLMDSNFRRAISLSQSGSSIITGPITIILLIMVTASIFMSIKSTEKK